MSIHFQLLIANNNVNPPSGLKSDSREKLFENTSDRDVEGLITDYLSALNKHVIFILEQKLGASVLRTTPIEFVLTVPAIWTESAKQKTLGACERASMSRSLRRFFNW